MRCRSKQRHTDKALDAMQQDAPGGQGTAGYCGRCGRAMAVEQQLKLLQESRDVQSPYQLELQQQQGVSTRREIVPCSNTMSLSVVGNSNSDVRNEDCQQPANVWAVPQPTDTQFQLSSQQQPTDAGDPSMTPGTAAVPAVIGGDICGSAAPTQADHGQSAGGNGLSTAGKCACLLCAAKRAAAGMSSAAVHQRSCSPSRAARGEYDIMRLGLNR